MEYEYILYIKEQCPWCVRAVNALDSREKHFKKISLDQNLKILEDLKEAYGWKTVPMVFQKTGHDNYTLLGGYTDLYEHLEVSDGQE